MKKQKNIVILDGTSLLYAAFFEIEKYIDQQTDFSKTQQFIANFLYFIQQTIQQNQPNYILYVFETHDREQTYRNKYAENYQSQIKYINSQFQTHQISFTYQNCIDLIQALGIAILNPIEIETPKNTTDSESTQNENKKDIILSVETDYIICDLVTKFQQQISIEKQNCKITIASINKLLYQLIDDQTTIYDLQTSQHLTLKNFNQPFKNIKPSQISDYYSLYGYDYLSIKGCEHVGNYYANMLLKYYNNIDNIIENLLKTEKKHLIHINIPKEIKQDIEKNQENIRLYKQLADSKKYADENLKTELFPLEKITLKKIDEEKVKKIIENKFNNNLLQYFFNKNKEKNQQTTPKKRTKKQTNSLTINITKEINAIKKAEFITSKEEIKKFLTAISLSQILVIHIKQKKETYTIHLYNPHITQETEYIIDGKAYPEIKKEFFIDFIQLIQNQAITLICLKYKELLKILKIHPEKSKTIIEDVSILNHLLDSFINTNAQKNNLIIKTIEKKEENPTIAIYHLFCFLKNKLTQLNIENIYTQIELPLIPIIHNIEKQGIKIDNNFLNQQKKLLVENKSNYTPQKYVFYIKKIESIQKAIDLTSQRVHTSLNQIASKTGRISSSNPNMQNLPQLLKPSIIADNNKIIIAADYSQVELRILAYLAQEKKLIEMFKNNEDVFKIIAAKIFNKPPSNINLEERQIAKTTNYAITYGITKKTLSQELNTSIEKAETLIKKYYETFPAIKEFKTKIEKFLIEEKCVQTMFNRKLFIPKYRQANKKNFVSINKAVNFIIQGTVADMTKKAMINITNQFQKNQINAQIILQVHDEILIEADEKTSQESAAIIQKEMNSALSIPPIPLKVNLNIKKHR